MEKFFAGVVVGVLMLGLGVRISRGQGASTVQMAHKEIRQGDVLNLDVTVDKAPNLSGTIQVVAISNGAGDLGMTCHLEPAQTKCETGQRIPLDEKLGDWTVSKITFMPLGGPPAKELTVHGDLSFRVIAHGDIVLPDSATVSDIK
jgi:hypothetical protein